MTGKRIPVFGATGATGRAFLTAAAGHGHHTVAFVRNPARLRDTPVGTIATGDVFDPGAVESAVDGADTVLIAFGLRGDRRTPLYSRGTATIVDAMRKTGVRRLLLLSEAAYGTHHAGIGNRIIAGIYGAVSAPAIAERRRQDEIVLAGGLDWTIVRPRVISDKPAGSPLPPRSNPHGMLTGRTSRAAIAGLLLDVIDDPGTYRRHIYP